MCVDDSSILFILVFSFLIFYFVYLILILRLICIFDVLKISRINAFLRKVICFTKSKVKNKVNELRRKIQKFLIDLIF